ncbi:MAG: hypothetical protein R3C26_10485 [Calditrichia bacterium]
MSHYRKEFGDWGEDIAEKFLLENGFTILMRNFRAARGKSISSRGKKCIVLWK